MGGFSTKWTDKSMKAQKQTDDTADDPERLDTRQALIAQA